MTDTKRNLNLDLIRCFALLAVLIMHYYDNSGFYNITIVGAGDFVMAVVRLLFTSCVPLFLMLTGYLCRKKQLSARYYLGILRVLELYVLCTAACIVFEYLYLGNRLSLRDMVGGLINFEIDGYAWYVLLYVGLFLMMPFLNMMYNGCSNSLEKKILIVSVFALSVLPSLMNIFFHIYSLWWEKLYPICYYFTGAYLGEYLSKKKPAHSCLALVMVLIVFCAFNQFMFDGQAINYEGVNYAHYQTYFVSLLIFVFLSSLNLDSCPSFISKAIYKIAELSFSAYLLSWISDGIIYREFVPYFPVPQDRFVWILVLVPLSLIFSLLLAQVIHWIYKPLDRLIRGRLLAMLSLKSI